VVTTEHVRELYFREPFEPFRIVLKSGRELIVEQPGYIAISPIGKDITFAPRIEDFEIIDMSEIDSLRRTEPAGVA
jgi:hypothetical protein